MTTYYNLPVYKQSYDLLLDIFKLTKEFNREYKYTIGEELKKETTAMIVNVFGGVFYIDSDFRVLIANRNILLGSGNYAIIE
jgi:hypothetical protein